MTHTPAATLTRDDTVALLPTFAGGADAAERFRATVERSRIDVRHVETPIPELARMGTGARSRVFESRLRAIAEDLGRRALDAAGVRGDDVSAVVTVSCTGYMLPSVDAYVLPRLGVSAHARRVPVTELGCSAGVGAIGLASELLHVRSGHALVISIELCSSCLQTQELSASDVIGNILFADAAAAAVIGPGTSGRRGPEILAARTVLWPDTTDALGMWLSDTGLRLVLSPDLPAIVGENLVPTVAAFLEASGVERGDVAFWIVHPGGPRVLETVGARLNLSDEELRPSWRVWEDYGNVSSATVLFILQALRARGPVPDGRLGVMMAFGPGLSCELVLLRAGGWLSGA